ncbi:protein phosphatase 2C domain-containing protein [Streptomyces agglomeratus]|uniref:protein phosphatase 2C domain-containing protein n=1 Tax=Streptomyces agglomeratus TaxID=285458 RepID=UPI00099F4161|nr:protein phosphatase 2C domain-containing protein [Streptomyces agglomeratus]
MSQQGERRATGEDEWWNRLYETEPVPDANRGRQDGDTLDARFDSAADTLSPPPPAREGLAPPAPPPSAREGLGPPPARPPEGEGLRSSAPTPVCEEPAPTPVRDGLAPPPAPEAPQAPSGPPPPSPPRSPTSSAPPSPPPTAPPSAPPPHGPPAPGPPPAAPPPTAPGIARRRAPWEPPEVPQVPPARGESGPEPSGGPLPGAVPAPRATPEAGGPQDAVLASGARPPAPVRPQPTRPPGPPAPVPPRPAHPAGPHSGPKSAAPAPARPAKHPAQPGAGPAAAPPYGAGALPESTGSGDGRQRGGRENRPRAGFVGDRPPTYDAEPTALPAADPRELGALVPDTVLDGARYGTYTLRAASVRGDSARYRGEPRRDALITARFGSGADALVLVAVAGGARAAGSAHLAAADACDWIGEAVGRSHARLADDIRAGSRGDLKSGLHRLTDRSYGRLRARASELGLPPEEYTVGLRCLLLPADPACRTRVFFGIGGGGLFRLRDGVWQDIEPAVPEPAPVTGAPVVGFGSIPSGGPGRPSETPEGDRLTMDLGIPTPPAPYVENRLPPTEPFRFRASVARPGDTLLLCSGGLADPLRGEPALAEELAERWAGSGPPGLAEYLADTCLRVKGYADDRTAVTVWEA